MCVVCGCSQAGPAEGRPVVSDENGTLHYGAGPARVSVPGLTPERVVRLEADVLGANDRLAAQNRAHFADHGVAAFNLVSSPGSGKTSLLCATIAALRARVPDLPVAVIEGDQQTSNDAERIRAAGAPAIQVNTGKGCHLDAQMVADAFGRLALHAQAHEEAHAQAHEEAHAHAHRHGHHDHGLQPHSLLFIENVGNLVCPAMWDLGERAKVAILSVTEGEDKPLKYPNMFAAAQLVLLNKIDLLPHVEFDMQGCIGNVRRVNPHVPVLALSARTGAGLDAWIEWLLHGGVAASTEAMLRKRIAELEARLAGTGAA